MALCALATAAATASAAEWFVAGKALGAKNTRKIAPVIKVVKSPVLTAAGTGTTIECKKLKSNTGIIEGTTSAQAKSLEFEECSVVKPANCKLSNNKITTSEITAEPAVVTGSTEEDSLTFKPKAGNVFTEPIFEGGGCLPAGKIPITGQCKVFAPKGQVEKPKQLVKAACKELELGENEAEFKGEFEIGLEPEENFSYH